MVNDKNSLYTDTRHQKDKKEIAKRSDAYTFQGRNPVIGNLLNDTAATAVSPATQNLTKVQVGDPVNDSFGTIGAVTQNIDLDVYGSNYAIFIINGDVTFGFDKIPDGRHIQFTLDLLIVSTNPTIILDPRLVNPPTIPTLAINDRLILHFEGVRNGSLASTRFVYIGGTIGGGGGAGLAEPVRQTLNTPTLQTAPTVTNLDIDSFTEFDLGTLDRNIKLALTGTLPINKTQALGIKIKQDAATLFTVDWSSIPVSTIPNNPPLGETQLVVMRSDDQGVTWISDTTKGGTAGVNLADWANFPAIANIDANNKDILKVKNIDFDDPLSQIIGLKLLDFVQTDQKIDSISTGIEYSVGNLQSHLFKSQTNNIAKFEEAAANIFKLDMLDHAIKDAKDISFDVNATFAGSGAIPTIGYHGGAVNDLAYNVPDLAKHVWTSNNSELMGLTASQLTFKDGLKIQANPNTTTPGISVGSFGGDPSSTTNGDIWYNSSTNKYRAKEDGVNVDVIGGGGGDSQTPWLTDIVAAGFDLNDLSNIEFRNTTGAPVGTIRAIYADSGGINSNVPTAQDHKLRINGAIEYTFSNTALDVKTNNVINISNLNFDNANQSIISLSTGIRHDVPTGDVHAFRINTSEIMAIKSTSVLFSQEIDVNGKQVIFDVDGDTIIESLTDDDLKFITGGTLGLSIINSQITPARNIIPATTSINLGDSPIPVGSGGNAFNNGYFDNTLFIRNLKSEEGVGNDINIFEDLDMQSGKTIDFSTSASNPSGGGNGGITIKVNGVTKVLRFYDP